jgi:tripartite-type tricarboxylate transporter receptor subunit TctC
MAKWIAATTLLAAQMLLGTAMGQAQEPYPSRPVRVICGFPAGTSADIMARIYAQKLSEKYGQPFVVENRLRLRRSRAPTPTATRCFLERWPIQSAPAR